MGEKDARYQRLLWLLLVVALLCIMIGSHVAVHASRYDLTALLWLIPVVAIMAALLLSDKESSNG